MTYLAVPISAETIEKAFEQAKKAVVLGAEMVELRTDYIENLSVGKFEELYNQVEKLDIQIIVTCRDVSEGGAHDYSEKLRLNILEHAIKLGSDFVDCEYANFVKDKFEIALRDALEHSSTRLILSAHDFEKPFKKIEAIYDGMLLAYPDCVPKLVYKPRHISDCFEGLDILHNKEGDAIVIAMGQEGELTRILAKKYDCLVCFASLNHDNTTAPGQVTIDQMKKIYRFDKINPQTEVFGVIGNPVSHSMSPAIHNGCFEASGYNGVYVPFLLKGDSVEFNKFMEVLKDRQWLDIKGFSVTIPHKENAMVYVSSTGGFVDDQAVKIAAVNTLTIGYNDRICAYNTDYEGALDAIVNAAGGNKSYLEHKTAAVVGAGGVSRAVVAALTDCGAKVTIYNRTVSRAKKLAKEFVCKYADIDEIEDIDASILVNCTSVGMYPDVDESPVPEKVLNDQMIVFDTVYNPVETRLLKQAKSVGAKTISGVEMFVYQGLGQYKHFTGQGADEKLMRKTVSERL